MVDLMFLIEAQFLEYNLILFKVFQGMRKIQTNDDYSLLISINEIGYVYSIFALV